MLPRYRFTYLEETQHYEKTVHKDVEEAASGSGKQQTQWQKHWASLKVYWPRLFVASFAWIANDFAFYGNKLFQSTFIKLLYPGATQA